MVVLPLAGPGVVPQPRRPADGPLDRAYAAPVLVSVAAAPPFGSAFAAAASYKKVVPPGGGFVVDEPSVEAEVGDPVDIPMGANVVCDCVLIVLGGRGVKARFLDEGTDVTAYVAARRQFLTDDVRILPRGTERDESDFPKTVGMMMADPLFKLPFSGPHTAPFMIDKAASSAVGGFVLRHDRWVATSGVSRKLPVIHEHEVISRALQYGVTVDKLNLKASVMGEFLLRRLQLQEDVVAENPDAPSYESASFYMGLVEGPGGSLMAPSLRAHVATELARDASILKEKRKAREAKHEDKGKGKGRGGRGGGVEHP